MSTYRERIAEALDGGWSFAGLYANAGEAPMRIVLNDDAGALRIEEVDPVDRTVPSIVDIAPAASWDEREAHDLYGIAFDGHEPLRPLVKHDLDVSSWTVPVLGRDPHQVAVGPIHAGVIESGHFRFHLVGEKILHLDARLFYKHRGLERAAEGASLADGLRYVSRACAACAVTNGVAYAHAIEQALGLRSPAELARVRTILLELERVWSHLNDISAVCTGTGLAAGAQRFAGLTERARRLNARLTGHRFLFGSVRVGGSDVELDASAVSFAREELGVLRSEAASGWRELLFNRSFDDRLLDVGIVRGRDVRRLGATGPAARAAGVAVDTRSASPNLAYDDFVPVTSTRAAGDVKSRVEQRHLELVQSFDLLEALLAGPVRPCSADNGGAELALAASRVESPRGATLCVVEREGPQVTRVHLRTGSYANWPVVAFAAVGNMLPDFPLINKSFELCYACADR
jgi:Ni,Fe-hydrogenase III large subunit